MRGLLYSVVVVLFLSALVACKERVKPITPSGKVLKIGVIVPFSGYERRYGENALMGVETALKLQPLLQNGDRVEMLVEDSHGELQKTIKAVTKLSKEGVMGLLLMANSDITLGVAPVVEQYKVPLLALNASHPKVIKENNYIAQFIFNDVIQGAVAALYIREELLVDRVAVISDPANSHYAFLADEFIKKFESLGGEIVEHISDLPEDNNFNSQLERLREENTQALYLVVDAQNVVHVSRSLNNISWTPIRMGSDGLLSRIVLNYKEDLGLVDGMMATDVYSVRANKTPYGKKVSEIYGKEFSTLATTYAGLSCEGTSVLLSAINRCEEKVDRSCVNSELRDTKGFIGIYGNISIHEDGSSARPIFVNVVEGKNARFLVKVY